MGVDTMSLVIKVSFVFWIQAGGKNGFDFNFNHTEVEQLSIKREVAMKCIGLLGICRPVMPNWGSFTLI